MKRTLLTAATAILFTAPAYAAGMPAECLGKLHLAKGSSEMVQKATKRVWRTSEKMMILGNEMRSWNAETLDAERMGTVVNQAGSAQQHLAWVVEIHLKNTAAAFDCISRNWPGTGAATAAKPASKHVIPVCGAEMARAKFMGRFCPSPWTEIWSTDFVGTYRRVWHRAATNSQYGSFLNTKGCGSAWLPKSYSRVK